MIKTTLCYIQNENRYLMLNRNKKTNDLNSGKWIGIGGKFMPEESKDECLIREVREETGIILDNYHFHGVIHFNDDLGNKEDMYLYTAKVDDVDLIDCAEGTLAWIDKNKVLELSIWEGDRLFLKKLLNDEKEIEMTLEYKEGKLVNFVDHLSSADFIKR